MINKRFLWNLLSFCLIFVGLVAIIATKWVKTQFRGITFADIVFHLQFPILGNDTPFLASFVLTVLLPSFVIALFVGFPNVFALFWRNILTPIATKIYTFAKKRFYVKLIFSLAIFALCVNITINSLKIKRYVNTQTNFSTLYESHYIAPKFALKDSRESPKISQDSRDSRQKDSRQKPQNLIIIFAESMESTLSAKNIPNNGGGGESSIFAIG